MQNAVTKRCIDDSSGYGLRANGCNGLNYQDFTWWWQNDGSVVMQNAVTKRCIDDSFGYGLRANGYNGLNYQDFVVTPH
jgi:hypothetical protein